MAVRKRNEYLEGDESDDDTALDYDSTSAEETKGRLTGRNPKRRRTDDASDEDSLQSFGPQKYNRSVEERQGTPDAGGVRGDSDEGAERLNGLDLPATALPSTDAKAKARLVKSAAAAEKAARQSGVVYISRVPPFMKPQTLRHYLAPHATKGLGRIFLTPEDHVAHTQRVKRGGNKKKSFTDGWVEFVSKREAKVAAETLNGNIIGGKKGNFYHDDLWNIKYLKGYKWSHLTEQIANENAERAARLREEIRKTRKENKAFLEDVERGKTIAGIENKRKAKQ
ncbi:hypothetical protein BAUCODRAFT_58555, partial [Baudoinia panamericana UAMH 10762]